MNLAYYPTIIAAGLYVGYVFNAILEMYDREIFHYISLCAGMSFDGNDDESRDTCAQ